MTVQSTGLNLNRNFLRRIKFFLSYTVIRIFRYSNIVQFNLFGLSFFERPVLDHDAKAHTTDFITDFMKFSRFHMKSARFHEIHPKPYKIRCFNKNSSVWGYREGAMTQDFMKSWVIAPLLHSSNWIVLVEIFAFIRFWVDFTWNLPDFMWNRKTTRKEL